MTVKLNRTGTPETRITIADSAALTIAENADFAIGLVIAFNGETAGYGGGYQAAFRMGGYQDAGNLICLWNPTDAATLQGKFYFQFGGGTANYCLNGPVEAGQAYLLVIQRAAGSMTSKLCPIQQNAPVNGDMVLTSAARTHIGAINVTSATDPARGDLVIGSATTTNRRLDQSVARFFRSERALTDFEIAQLAYGKEITTFTTPSIYLRLNDAADTLDSGSQSNTVVTSGLTNGAALNFGFSSVPTAPVIASKPVINGAPVQGVATGYTASPATGNPSPTTTQQWSINGVDVNGAVNPTYTPITADVGKLLRVRQIESNGVNPAASSTSDPVIVASSAVTITPSEQPAEAIRQQISGVAAVPVTVAFSGATPAKLEYQLYDVDGSTITKVWADTGLAPAGGQFAGNVAMPTPTTGRKNRVAYRTKDTAGNVMITSPVGTNRFGIGDTHIGIGSSSMTAWFGSGSGSNMVVDHNRVSTMSNTTFAWELFGEYGQAGQMAMYWSEQLGYPIAFLSVAVGGTNLATWADKTSGNFQDLVGAINAIGGKIAGVFSTCGSNDITGESSAASVQAHLDKLRTLAANIREATGQPTLPILHSGINRRTNANSDIQADNARKAEALYGDDPNVLHVQTLDFELSGDGTHLTGAGYINCCARIRYVWLEHRKFGIYRRGPKSESLRFTGNQINVQMSHRSGNDFTPLTNITGFVVVDERTPGVFTPITITACARTNATNIKITCAEELVAPKVTYLAGMGPEVGTQVFDNGPQALPMTAEPFMVTTAGAIEQPLTLVPFYNEYTISRSIQSEGSTLTGTFTSYQLTSSGTLRANQECKYTWYSGGVIGSTGGSASVGAKLLDVQARLTVSPLPMGPGFMLMEFADGGVALQKGTVA